MQTATFLLMNQRSKNELDCYRDGHRCKYEFLTLVITVLVDGLMKSDSVINQRTKSVSNCSSLALFT